MSMDRCSRCSALIDTDDDTEFYNEYTDEGLCESCRDDLWKEKLEDERLDDPRHEPGK